MKKPLFIILLALSVPISAVGGSFLTRRHEQQWLSQSLLAQESKKPLHHVVLFDFKDSLSAEDKAKVVSEGKTLLSEIPGVVEVQLGDKAREDREVHIKNYDLALYVEFESNAALDIYAPHEKHQEFLQLVRPLLEEDGVQVIDFYGLK